MRLLVVIPHFFSSEDVEGAAIGAFHSRGDRRAQRVAALSRNLAQLGALFGPVHLEIDYSVEGGGLVRRRRGDSVEVLIATHQHHHVLDDISLPSFACVVPCDDEAPMNLGFACHALLQDRADAHDIYAFIEDDLVLHDPDFLTKLAWFNAEFGEDVLLQPNRYENGPQGTRVYVDGDLPPFIPRPPEPPGAAQRFATNLGRPLRFDRRLNPMSGCFFLSAAQLARWINSPFARDRDASFLGPLESAQILPLMKIFPIYKPGLEVAHFLEIEHADARLSQLSVPQALIRRALAQSSSA